MPLAKLARPACALLLLCTHAGAQQQPLPIFDAHLHYNREPEYRLALPEVLKLFSRNNVKGILATSRPNDGTRLLVDAKAPDLWVVPFIRPYRVRADIQTWFNDPATLDLIETEFRRGYYRGIGEFHVHGANARTDVVRKVVEFAKRHGLWLHAHSDAEAIEAMLAIDPQAKIIWAHTGFSESAEKVDAMLRKHPGLVGELSYRGGITGMSGLSPEWRKLFEQHADRFLLGSDTWINERWDSYTEIIQDYRRWLALLPREAAEKIAWKNAERLFAQTPGKQAGAGSEAVTRRPAAAP